MHRRPLAGFACLLLLSAAPMFVPALVPAPALAQDRGTLDPRPPAPLADPADPPLAAKEVFGREREPAAGGAHVYGTYARGCIAGARAMPLDGPDWQVMRPSRNRYWGHPLLIRFLERLAARVRGTTGAPGILIGDMAQPRGGPMLGGHASHQVGLDADVWLKPMPDHRMSAEEREFSNSTMMVREDRRDVDPRLFTRDVMGMVKAAAVDPEVQRIFVNAAIKKAICREARGDRSWLEKVRPMYGHDYHFHIRLFCPSSEPDCVPQAEVPGGDGCDRTLDRWLSPAILHPRPAKPPPFPRPPLTMAFMSDACRAVAGASSRQASGE